MSGSRRIAVAVAVIALLAATAAALAAGSITKHNSRIAELAPGATRTLTAPYPDALEYGNARYYGTVGTGVAPGRMAPSPTSSASRSSRNTRCSAAQRSRCVPTTATPLARRPCSSR